MLHPVSEYVGMLVEIVDRQMTIIPPPPPHPAPAEVGRGEGEGRGLMFESLSGIAFKSGVCLLAGAYFGSY